jgi:hypothetical protein
MPSPSKTKPTKKPPARQAKEKNNPVRKAVSKTASKERSLQGISSQPRLEKLLKETEAELIQLQPKIERLEKEMENLRELRHQKQKLITLKLSLQSILENFQLEETEADYLDLDSTSYPFMPAQTAMPSFLTNRASVSHTPYKMTPRQGDPYQDMTFYPDVAMEEAEQLLKQKGSLNYELFRSIVLHGGRATTQEIRQFLIDHEIVQPGTGVSFEDTPLTDISSRVNYLIRKDLVTSIGRGRFASKLGWK